MAFFAPFANPWRTLRFKTFYRKARKERPQRSQSKKWSRPRNEDFYKDKDFLRLKESVAKYGVIVPVIIKRLSKHEDGIRFQLIDGERRWKAAIDT
ncbi:MAG: ParB/Srx family N-terminal domain-containing protein, partial [Acidobacteriia bacterium]|nr:ParB/Srx family N-terminal domain-containing protein [Terriglobia bacterium]